MIWIGVLSYLAGMALFMYLLFGILTFIMATADILSTIYFVYILGFGWKAEENVTVREFGNSIGHFNALLVNHLVMVSVLYLLGVILKKHLNSLVFIYKLFIILFSSATLINIIFPTLKKFFDGHT